MIGLMGSADRLRTERADTAGMGLPVRKVQVTKAAWELLQKDVWSDDYVDAELVHQHGIEAVKLRYRGGHTRNYPKKSFEIKQEVGTIHWNAEYDDPSAIRNALSFEFFRWIGVPSPVTQHCRLELNTEDLGVYTEIEGVDRRFFACRNLSCDTLIYAANDDATFGLTYLDTGKLKKSLFDGYERVIGRQSDRERLERFIFDINVLPSRKLPGYLDAHLDIDNYLRWLAGAVCTGNYDGFNQNYALYASRAEGVYRFIPWDYEGTWGRNCYGKRCDSGAVRIRGYNTLTAKLLGIKSITRAYGRIVAEIVEQWFTPARLEPEIERWMTSIREDVLADDKRRWSASKFDTEAQIFRTYIRERRDLLVRSIASLS